MVSQTVVSGHSDGLRVHSNRVPCGRCRAQEGEGKRVAAASATPNSKSASSGDASDPAGSSWVSKFLPAVVLVAALVWKYYSTPDDK